MPGILKPIRGNPLKEITLYPRISYEIDCNFFILNPFRIEFPTIVDIGEDVLIG